MNVIQIAIYIRKSRADMEEERQAVLRGEHYDTLKRHRVELLQFARKSGYEVVEVYEEIVTGDTIEARPEMKRLLADVKQFKYDAVLVVDYDRLGRGDKSDQGEIEKIFKKTSTLIITPYEIIDLNTEEGEFKADTKSFISRMEFRQIKKRLKEGKKRSTREGKEVSNRYPYGYTKDPTTQKLVPDENADNAKLIFEIYDELGSIGQTVLELFRIGIPTKTGKDYWDYQTLSRMLKNKKYIGYQFFNKDNLRQYVETPNSHTALIDEELFYRVQEKLAKHDTPKARPDGLKNPFAGIQVCGKCGQPMKQHTQNYCYVKCINKFCDNRFIRAEAYEKEVLNQLHGILENITINVDKLETHNSKLTQYEKELALLERERNKLATRHDNIYISFENGIYTADIFNERMNTYKQDKKDNDIKIAEVLNKIEYERSASSRISELAPTIRNTLDVYSMASIEQKNRLLKSFILEIKAIKLERFKPDFELEIVLKE